MKVFLVAAAILAFALPPTQASTIILNSDSATLIGQVDPQAVFKTEAAIKLSDETKADITGAVADSQAASDNSPDQTPDDPMADQENLLCLEFAIMALRPARPSQAFEICPIGF